MFFIFPSPVSQYSSVKAFQVVIPAKAGIQAALLQEEAPVDSRLRGNDEIMGLCAELNCMVPRAGERTSV